MKLLILLAFIATAYCYPNEFYGNYAPIFEEPSGIASPIEIDAQKSQGQIYRRIRRDDAEYSITPHIDGQDGVQNAGVTAERKTEHHDTKVFWNKDINRGGKPNWGIGGTIRW